MLIISRLNTLYTAIVNNIRLSSFFLFSNARIKIFGNGKLEIIAGAKLILGCNWTGLPLFVTGLKIDDNAILRVNGSFKIYSGSVVAIYGGGQLTLGSGYLNNFCDVHCFHKIIIGNNVIISSHVNIRDSDNHIISGQKVPMFAPIVIEDNVWIGMRATILKGVTIGRGAVVAAGAIVTKDVPPYSLVAGNPAKVIRENINWE